MRTDQHAKGPAVTQTTDGEGASPGFQETEIKSVFHSSLSLEYLNSEGIKHIHFKEKFKANL